MFELVCLLGKGALFGAWQLQSHTKVIFLWMAIHLRRAGSHGQDTSDICQEEGCMVSVDGGVYELVCLR